MKVQELTINNIKNYITNKYITFDAKVAIAKNIIYENTMNNNLDFVGIYKTYIYNVIKYYTDIEYSDENYDEMRNDFDFISVIFEEIKDDLKELNMVIELEFKSYKMENSLENNLIKFLNNLNQNFGDYIEKAKNKITEFNLEDYDIEELKNKLFDQNG